MEHISKVAFPGLGIGEFDLNNVAVDLGDFLALFGKEGGFPIFWYGVIITCGIILAFLYVTYRGKYESVKSDDIMDITLWTVIIGVIGARLYFVIMELDHYIPESGSIVDFFNNVINLRNGGLAIYGGIIAGACTIIVVTVIKKINFLKLWDMAAPGVMIAQSLGRWGNFFNGEAFGSIVEEGHPLYFMRMGLISNNTKYIFKTSDMVYVHPTFLYESLWNLAGFILINIFYKKKKFNGQIACMYLAWYGIGRFFVEGLRTDSLYIPGTELRVSQLVGIICFVVFGGALVAGFIYAHKKFGENEEPLNAFGRYLKPELIEHPVFFEKKAEKSEDVWVNEEFEDNDTKSEETEKIDTEEEKNGEDN